MRRRGFAFLLAASLAAGSLFGCKKGGEEETSVATAATTAVDTNESSPADYGKIYSSPIDEKHVAAEEISLYIDNEILIVVKDGTTEDQVSKLAEKYNARIVGAIEVSGDYQLQLDEVRSKSELEAIMQQLNAEEVVDSTSLNYISFASEASEGQTITGREGFSFGEKWQNDLQNWTDVKGKSWGFEAINTIGAWDELNKHKEQVKPVRVGLVDGGFDTSHYDLGFAEVLHNDAATEEQRKHGTHVAGIIAAKTNNDIGICGVYPYGDGNLYGVSFNVESPEARLASVMYLKTAYAELLVRNVKVINTSLGFNWYKFDEYQVKFLGSNLFTNYDSVKDMMETPGNITKKAEEAKPLGDFLDRMLRKGYDFVITTSAGNDSGGFAGHIDCRLSSWNTVIRREDYPDVFDRIIVVGALDNNLKEAGYSNGGRRVDIYAPGGTEITKIYSTIPGNDYGWLDGTSQAAPHVAGVAAMVWSANNSLKGDEVKRIITKEENKSSLCTSCKMVDAQKAVSDAFKTKGTGNAENPENGIVMGYVVERFYEDKKIEKAKIEFKNIETGEVVYIENPTTKEKVLPETDREGHFEVALPEGKYSLTVKADGFEDYEWPDGEDFENPLVVQNGQVKYLESWIKLKRPGRKEVQFTVFALEEDTLKPIDGKKITLMISDPELTCKNPEQTTGKDGSVIFDIPMGEKNKTITTKVTLHIDGYKDFILDDYVFENDEVDMLLQVEALFEKEVTLPDVNDDGYLVFGRYEQDNNTENGKEPIEWVVLEENEKGRLVISRYILDCVPFNNKYEDVTWETCSLREWLNNDFLNEAFSKAEQTLIPKVHLKNSGVEMPGGNDTEDQIFCLSLEEVAKYYEVELDKYAFFGFCKELITLPTEYAKANGLHTFRAKDCIDEPIGDEYWMDGYAPKGYQASITDLSGTYWWLRTMGWDTDACAVFPNGYAGPHYESGVSSGGYGVRPVIWIGEASEPETETPTTEEVETKPTKPAPNPGADVEINEVNFPAEALREYVSQEFDLDENGVLSSEELSQVEKIYLSKKELSSLQGIEYFYNLQSLDLRNVKITDLDISYNTALTSLVCDRNGLTELDISHNTELKSLLCTNNKLTELDISHNTALETLHCEYNSLTALDVSHNPNLVNLICYNNKLTALDVSQNPALVYLSVNNNSLSGLDLNQNPALEILACAHNNVTALDITKNKKLESLIVDQGTQVTGLTSKVRVDYEK